MALAYKNAGAWGGASGTGIAGRLTSLQGDNNIWELSQQIAAVVAAGTAIGIDPDNPVTISGDQLTFHFSDDSETTITLPTAMPVWRGEFAAVSYAVADWFSSSGTIYRVLVAHTGELPFDPGATSTASGDLYAKVLDYPSIPGYTIDETTFTPELIHANSYIRCTNVLGCLVTIDPSVEFESWTELHFRSDLASITFDVSTPGSINSQYGCLNISAGAGATVTLKKVGTTDAWDIFGLLQSDTTA